MKKLSAIGVSSVFKMSLVLGAVSGLLYGFMAFLMAIKDRQFLEGVIAMILAPLLMSITMALVNAAMVWVYNRAAERLGGIEITLEE